MEALKTWVASREGLDVSKISNLSTYDNHYGGCDTCGHGEGYVLTISFTYEDRYRSVEVEGYSITDILNQILDAK
jgi:hypothetical protein